MGSLDELHQQGQSIWLDYIQRGMITSGELERLVDSGLRGLTSNPTIFENAIGGSADYDEAISAILGIEPDIDNKELFEWLAVQDIRMAADVLKPVYDGSDGGDGFVSLEVSPHLAHETTATVEEARRLWRLVERPNLMIKVPATPEGIPAVETLISEGININITLMFSVAHYEAVAQSYIRGLERNSEPSNVSSVASFFVSRVDGMVDPALEGIGTPEALGLRGKIAVVNSKMAYRRFKEIFYGEPFAPLKSRGARVQRPLWGSTSTKNPAYSDVLYVEELIGPDTVNTIPLSTLNAFLDHGRVLPSLLQDWERAERSLAELSALGIDLSSVAERLQQDGVAAFTASYDKLLDTLNAKRRALAVE